MQLDIYGTRLTLSLPFVAVVTLMLLFCEEKIVAASLFSSFFHECGHLFFMLFFGEKPALISFGAFGIRIERGEHGFLSNKCEVLIALGGVIFNFLLCLVGTVFYFFSKSSFGLQFALINTFIAFFNLLPVRILDMGSCLECVLPEGGNVAYTQGLLSRCSRVTALVIFISCILYCGFFGINVSLIAVSIYIILVTTLKE